MPTSVSSVEAGAPNSFRRIGDDDRNHTTTLSKSSAANGRKSLEERADNGNAVKKSYTVGFDSSDRLFSAKFEIGAQKSANIAEASVDKLRLNENNREDSSLPIQSLENSGEYFRQSRLHGVEHIGRDVLGKRNADAEQHELILKHQPVDQDGPGAQKIGEPSSLAADRLLELVLADGSLPPFPSRRSTSTKHDFIESESHPAETSTNIPPLLDTGAPVLAMDMAVTTDHHSSPIDASISATQPLESTRLTIQKHFQSNDTLVTRALPLSPIDEQKVARMDDELDMGHGVSQETEIERQTVRPKRFHEHNGVMSPAFVESPLSPNIRATNSGAQDRPSMASRAMSTPVMRRKTSSNKTNGLPALSIPPPKSARATSYMGSKDMRSELRQESETSGIEQHTFSMLPIPPLSLPTHLHLELSSSRPSPLYIQRQQADDLPYEPSHIKLERLLNFLLLPPMLEQVLLFGALACFDAWLYTFTILPLRFLKALIILVESWCRNLLAEVDDISHYIYAGLGRVWRRRKLAPRETKTTTTKEHQVSAQQVDINTPLSSSKDRPDYFRASSGASSSETVGRRRGHRRTKSGPSLLLPVDKADILKGLLIIASCYILMFFDASMMYHNIRGQAAIKLYVIYNALEVFDRLLSALGQDVLECLFAKDTLDRKPNGRSKLLRPAWLFMLALVYNVIHSLALFYQVITLNVAVNSYSNALLTLLMSNQFVEIKSTVFKKIEKENLFQMTCADIVERFQLWLMLIIIASRNIVETGGLSGLSGGNASNSSPTDRGPSLLPHSFTLLPDWTGVVMGPFFLVLGTEMLVDWIKHAYINKFNATKPNIYGRFLDILAKDYYSRAFTDPDLTRRVGLATIPLSCLFIRASVQTYHMFLATHTITSIPSTTSLEDPFTSPETTPAIKAAIQHIDGLFKRAIFGADTEQVGSVLQLPWLDAISIQLPSLDTVLTYPATILIFSIFFLLLLILKILLGMFLLSYARGRYATMQQREKETSQAEGKRFGGWGVVELGDEKRKWIYEDDPEGLKKMRDREKDTREREGRGGKGLERVERYSMVAKRIW